MMNQLVKQKENYSEVEIIEMDLLLEGIYRLFGYDFRNYMRPSIYRRIWHRIHSEKLTTISSLQEQVLHYPEMLGKLLDDFSINVTEMFRDPLFFLTFRKAIVPILKKYASIRIWHAGCSTGEEALSMAILLYEEGLLEKTKIYATDMNEQLVEKAKKGSFPIDRMKLYTKNYLEAGGKQTFSEYYEVRGREVFFHQNLLNSIIFAQHNLAMDSSFNDFHVIICRNVLIYFDKDLQMRVHQLFYESLRLGGFLGLGKKESLRFTTITKHYEEINEDERLYRKYR